MTQAPYPTVHADADTLEVVRERRARLRRAMAELAAAAEAPLVDAPATWAATLTAALAGIAVAWERHIAITEDDGGLFGQIRTDAPNLDPQLRRLHREHESIRESIAVVRAGVTAAAADLAMLQQQREAITTLLSDLIRHRQRGADVVYEAYEVDLGGGG